jgi:hypothetical protein
MEVILVVFTDKTQTELIGIMIFKSFSDLMRKTENYFIYADAKKSYDLKGKKSMFRIIIKK